MEKQNVSILKESLSTIIIGELTPDQVDSLISNQNEEKGKD
jgi:hypothetical protein